MVSRRGRETAVTRGWMDQTYLRNTRVGKTLRMPGFTALPITTNMHTHGSAAG